MSTGGRPLRSKTATSVPSARRRSTIAAPIPEAPPVTIALLPFSPRMRGDCRPERQVFVAQLFDVLGIGAEAGVAAVAGRGEQLVAQRGAQARFAACDRPERV